MSIVCGDCQNCCVDVAAPKRLLAQDSCCYCGELVSVKIVPNAILPAGTILGALDAEPMTYNRFDPNATDGTQRALLILYHDVCTDANGKIQNWGNLWGCGRDLTQAYVCGKFDRRDVLGDLAAAKASGLPIREINGWVYLG